MFIKLYLMSLTAVADVRWGAVRFCPCCLGCRTATGFSRLLPPLCCPDGPGGFSLRLRLARQAVSAMGLQERLLCLLHLLSADLSPLPSLLQA